VTNANGHSEELLRQWLWWTQWLVKSLWILYVTPGDNIRSTADALLDHQQKTIPSGRNGSVRDTLAADYSAPGINTTCRVAYRPPSAVSPFLLSPSVSYVKQTLWHCGQLWPYVGMGSLGTHLHWDWNAMGDAAKISPRVPSTLSSRNIGRRWEDMILPGHEDPRNRVDPWNLRQSEWDQKLGKIESEFSLYDKMRWIWDDVYLLRGLPNIYSPSLCPPPLPVYHRTTAVAPWRCTWSSMSEMHLETEIEWTQRCTWRPGSSEFGDALGGHDCANLQAVIRRVWKYTWRPWSGDFEDALGGRDRASLEMHLEAKIKWTQKMHLEAVIHRVWRCTLRLWPSEFGDALAGYNRARLEEYLEVVDLEGRCMLYSVYAVLGVCCTQC